MDSYYAGDLRDTIRTRLADLFHPFSLDFENIINIDICLAEARKLGMTAFMAVLRTWINSWATSHRSHDPTILPCLFGCLEGKDSLQHYIHCPHLFALMRYHNGTVSEDPLSRLGLVNPSLDSLNILCSTFAGYHSVRRGIRTAGTNNMESLTSGAIRHHWTVFASAYEVDARERSTACVKFSVSKFVAFLVFGHHSPSESHTANADLTVSTVESVPVSEFYWENEIVIQDNFFDSSNSDPTRGSDSDEESPVLHAFT